MIARIIISLGILIGGMILSRLFSLLAARVARAGTHDNVRAKTASLRRYSLTIMLILTALFLGAIIIYRESFQHVARLYVLVSIIYIVAINIYFFIRVLQSRTGILYPIIALIARCIGIVAVILFFYFASGII